MNDNALIYLTQKNLHRYFKIADETSSWYKTPTNTFDFVNRRSDTLVVTIGDSWTYGASLVPKNRVEQVFGNHLSKMFESDWLNLGISAQGNFWITEQVESLVKIIPKLHYKEVIVICTFTGIGRWFNTRYDLYIDYINLFKNVILDDFDKLLVLLNQECVSRILNAVNKVDNIKLKVGTNFVDHIGFESLSDEQIIHKPWYTLLTQDTQEVFNCSYYGRLDNALQFMDKQYHESFKEWYIDLASKAKHRNDILGNNPDDFFEYHPLENGHVLWAKYIKSEIDKL